jgi:hypothetical protein
MTKALRELSTIFDEEIFEQCKDSLKSTCEENMKDVGDIGT